MTANIEKNAVGNAGHAGHSIFRKAAAKLLEFTVCSFTGWLYEVLLTLAVQ